MTKKSVTLFGASGTMGYQAFQELWKRRDHYEPQNRSLVSTSPWDFDQETKVNPFFAQVWNADQDLAEDYFFPEDSIHDIQDADYEWINGSET